MKSIFKKLSIILVLPLMMVAVVGLGGIVGADNGAGSGTTSCDVSGGLQGGLDCVHTEDMVENIDGEGGIITTIVNVMFYVIGILSVIMIIWGGITYTTSRGNSEKTKAAKNTIIYAVVGLVFAIVAWAIVNWVVDIFN